MLFTKLTAVNDREKPSERDLQEASEITGEPIEKIQAVGRYGRTGNICDVYFTEPVRKYINDEPVCVVSMVIAKSGRPIALKDVDNYLHEVW